MATEYTCKECGKKVAVVGDKITRTCVHDNATIVASIGATAYGKGSLRHGIRKY